MDSVVVLSALVGIAMYVWILNDIWRIIVLEILLRLHRANKTIIIEHIVAAHLRMVYQCSTVEYSVEELSETVIDVVSRFTD